VVGTGRRARSDAVALLIGGAFGALVLATAAKAVSLAGSLHGAGDVLRLVVVACYGAWVVTEAPVTFRGAPRGRSERRTLVWYALIRTTVVLAAVAGPVPRSEPWWLVAVFAALFAAGALFRASAIRELGRWYSHYVAVQDRHVIVSSGPYRFVRHPAYTGMLAANAGLVGLLVNPVAVVALLGLVAVLRWRIAVEEAALGEIPEYREFARRRPRLVPGLW
jgi:protein-S-isoprenylcysteine O-methyltransferase Ste14